MLEEFQIQKTAFRVAFDFLKRQTAKIDAYTDEGEYFKQAFADLHETGFKNQGELVQNLLLDSYGELENIWKRRHN